MNASLRVKICGITNIEDALCAIDAGADALGFNLFPGSKRHIPLDQLSKWLPELPASAQRVAVMVNPTSEELLRARPFFDVIQLHGQETPDFCAEAAASGTLWKALPLIDGLSARAVSFRVDAILIDSCVPGAFGGSGIPIDFERAALFVRSASERPVWLSGGLAPGNVAAAVRQVRPFGVDVASGVEAEGNPRRKDPARLRAFIAAARSA